jgi:hypothetical protein
MAFELPGRFWAKVMGRDPANCWIWNANTRQGYGRFKFQGRVHSAHRLIAQACGIEVAGQIIRHSCDTPSCVNPSHLIPGTQKQNVEDRDARNRGVSPRGELNGNSQLTTSEVDAIRKAAQAAPRTKSGKRFARGSGIINLLAEEFQIDRTTVYQIINRKTWRN